MKEKSILVRNIPIPGRDRVKTDLNQLYPGEDFRKRLVDYYTAKVKLSAWILVLGVILALVLHCVKSNESIVEDQWMYRGTAEEGIQRHEITGRVEDGGTYSFQIDVIPRKYREEELQTIYEQFADQLPQLLLGKNESTDHVKEDLQLLENYDNFPFSVEWTSDSPEVIGVNGSVFPQLTETVVHLNAAVCYEEFNRDVEVTVIVAEKAECTQETERSCLEELLQHAQEEVPESEKFPLPTEMDGRNVSWEEKRPKTEWYILTGAVFVAIAVFFLKDRDLHDTVEKKKTAERREYPGILQKMTLYLETGLTVRTAFCHIAQDYEKVRNKGGQRREAYEEILMAAREIHMGVPEAAAYEKFGKRTGVREYVRLSTFLTQNLKKGSITLLQQLKEEAQQAMEMQIQNAKKLSEEASTKLLLPMILLLVIVMVMIMVPAFSGVGV